jgi:hypothetical protein
MGRSQWGHTAMGLRQRGWGHRAGLRGERSFTSTVYPGKPSITWRNLRSAWSAPWEGWYDAYTYVPA